MGSKDNRGEKGSPAEKRAKNVDEMKGKAGDAKKKAKDSSAAAAAAFSSPEKAPFQRRKTVSIGSFATPQQSVNSEKSVDKKQERKKRKEHKALDSDGDGDLESGESSGDNETSNDDVGEDEDASGSMAERTRAKGENKEEKALLRPGAYLSSIADDKLEERPEIVRGTKSSLEKSAKQQDRRERKTYKKEAKKELGLLPKEERRQQKADARAEKQALKQERRQWQKKAKSPKGEKTKIYVKKRGKRTYVRHQRNLVGQTIYKGTPSWELMIAIQTAIRFCVGKAAAFFDQQITSEEKFRDSIAGREFYKSTPLLRFPQTGSTMTPSHRARSFKFKDYCPLPFRHLRQKFGVDTSDYLVSMCNTLEDGSNALRELPSPGKSGSLFFFSHDMKYILKTIPKREAAILIDLLPDYYQHCMKYSNTLLPRFFGLHRFKPHRGRQVRMVVMANVFLTNKKIHLKYDLKGSELGRRVPEAERAEKGDKVVFKDLDWIEQERYLNLGPEKRRAFLDQLRLDVDFLKRESVMDYSLLVGLHLRDRADSADASSDPDSSGYDTHSETDSAGSDAPPARRVSKLPGNSSSDSASGLELPETSSEDSHGAPSRAASQQDEAMTNSSEDVSEAIDGPSKDKHLANSHISTATTSSYEGSGADEEAAHAVPRNVEPTIVGVEDSDQSSTIDEDDAARHRGRNRAQQHRRTISTLTHNRYGVPKMHKGKFGSLRQTTMLLALSEEDLAGSIFEKDSGGIRAHDRKGRPLNEHYFVGVIDILMNYTARKRGERVYKQIRYGSANSISSIDPVRYGDRFYNFVESITK